MIDPSSDKGVELSLHETGTYEKGIIYFIYKEFKGEGSFVDVGANIGLMSCIVAKNFPKNQVIGFEAHPETFKILKENRKLNDLDNADIREVAIGSEPGIVTIYNNSEENRGGASIVDFQNHSTGFEVKQSTTHLQR